MNKTKGCLIANFATVPSKSATNPARGTAVRHRLIGFSAAFLLGVSLDIENYCTKVVKTKQTATFTKQNSEKLTQITSFAEQAARTGKVLLLQVAT
ncbi:hypothetical protein [Mangrovibacter phragmitis]|uniref:hypothetical protein n=1 Tax=Mangrovibacter phragmitis TaxID=1691903 RepID=UPI00336A6C52